MSVATAAKLYDAAGHLLPQWYDSVADVYREVSDLHPLPTRLLVTDSTGAHTFDLGSLASVPTYDGSGNLATVTYGPDAAGRSIRQTSTWVNGVWQGDSAWVLV